MIAPKVTLHVRRITYRLAFDTGFQKFRRYERWYTYLWEAGAWSQTELRVENWEGVDNAAFKKG